MSTDDRSQTWTRFFVPTQGDFAVVNVTLGFADNDASIIINATEHFFEEAQKRGWLINTPELGQSDEVAVCEYVMRRQKEDGTPIIAFYPAAGGVMNYKFTHWYINTEDDYVYFEENTGLRVADLPIYEGQSFWTRKGGQPHKLEVKLPHPVEVVRTPVVDRKTGEVKKMDDGSVWKIFKMFKGKPRIESTDYQSDDDSGAAQSNGRVTHWKETIRTNTDATIILGAIQQGLAEAGLQPVPQQDVVNVLKNLGFTTFMGNATNRVQQGQLVVDYFSAAGEIEITAEIKKKAEALLGA